MKGPIKINKIQFNELQLFSIKAKYYGSFVEKSIACPTQE